MNELEMLRRWREASDAFLVATLLVAMVAVSLSVVATGWSLGTAEVTLAQMTTGGDAGGGSGAAATTGGDSGGSAGGDSGAASTGGDSGGSTTTGGDSGGSTTTGGDSGGSTTTGGDTGGSTKTGGSTTGGSTTGGSTTGGTTTGGKTTGGTTGSTTTGGTTTGSGKGTTTGTGTTTGKTAGTTTAGSSGTGAGSGGRGGGTSTGDVQCPPTLSDVQCTSLKAVQKAKDECCSGGSCDADCAIAIFNELLGGGAADREKFLASLGIKGPEKPAPTPRGGLAALRARSPGLLPASELVAAAVERVATPLSSLLSALAAASALISGLSAALALPGGLLQALLPFLSVRKRRPHVGRVMEAGTNLPIGGAVVTILDEAGKPRQTIATKADGTFGVLLPKGKYSLDVRKADYALAREAGAVSTFPGELLYQGGAFTVESEETVVPLVIALRPLSARARRTSFIQDLRHLWERFRVLQAKLALPLLFLGAGINTLALLQTVTPLLIAFQILYAILFVFELGLARVVRRAIGRVRDTLKRQPVALAIVRLVDANTKRLVTTRVTSPSGQFLLMPQPGHYLLQVIHTAYVPYLDKDLNVGKGITGTVRVNVDLKPRSRAS